MEHSEDYKVSPEFDLGVDHSLEIQGVVVGYHNGVVAGLQEELIVLYNRLATVCNQFNPIDSYLKGVGDRANTVLLEEKRSGWLRDMLAIRADALNMMVEIFKAGAEPVPMDVLLDKDIAKAVQTNILLRDAAITAVGGLATVNDFRVSAEANIHDCLMRTYAQAIIHEAEALAANQGAQDLAVNQGAEDLAVNQGAEDLAVNQGAEDVAVNQGAEDVAVNQGAEVKASAEDRTAKTSAAKEGADEQGPAAGLLHKEAKLHRSPVPEEPKAQRERRCRSPLPRG